ncbi:hypothetical protein L210DRAFT_3408593 [Boletus edulis BED1]|uniref:Uncharacterized protein n=1 Tax=Boletus edulis BED1 TaxID=1328754 RepID=A0AAD4GBS6_BOLED|nr:hypothetical protein L210DRAFT_3408593 [Boletus edulis BED1]
MPPLGAPLAHHTFNLNTAGVAGFFGGEEAISAMATVHLYEKRRFFGWFNSPGSYTIAKRFGRMANSRFWDGLFPGPNDSPAVSFGLDGKKGPQYIAALSGTTLTTGHLGYLTMKRKRGKVTRIEGNRKTTTPFNVSYLAMNAIDETRLTEIKLLPVRKALWGLIPITVSVVTCIICALVYDWFSFSMIFLGIVSSGLASLFIGRGTLIIKSVRNPAEGAPAGHGILIGEDGVVLIKGAERDVNVITKGRFELIVKWSNKKKNGVEKDVEQKGVGEEHGQKKNEDEDDENDNAPKYHVIGLCSLLLLVQFLVQLLLIPQGSLLGQIMFLVSLGASWVYNSYLSSLEEEKIQENILFDALEEPKTIRFRTGTRTTMAVFACLLLFHRVKGTTANEEHSARVKILNACLSNDTAVWTLWKEKIVQHLLGINDRPDTSPSFEEDLKDKRLSEFPEQERKLFKQLLDDAHDAFNGYFSVRDDLPDDSSQNS